MSRQNFYFYEAKYFLMYNLVQMMLEIEIQKAFAFNLRHDFGLIASL